MSELINVEKTYYFLLPRFRLIGVVDRLEPKNRGSIILIDREKYLVVRCQKQGFVRKKYFYRFCNVYIEPLNEEKSFLGVMSKFLNDIFNLKGVWR